MIKASKQTRENLVKLQEIDVETVNLVRDSKMLEMKKKIERYDKTILKIRELADPLDRQIAELNKKLAQIKQDIQIAVDREEKLEKKASAGGSSPKEAHAIMEEQNLVKKRQKNLEKDCKITEEKISEAEEAKKSAEEKEESIARLRDQLKENSDKLLAQVKKNYSELSEVRAEIAKNIDEDILKLYEKIRKVNHGVAVLKFENGEIEDSGYVIPAPQLAKIESSLTGDYIYRLDEPDVLVVKVDQ